MVIHMEFPDKMVTYETFVKDLATALAPMLKEMMGNPSDVISQREAFKRYGQDNVKRWRDTGRLVPLSKRPGKLEYRVADLMVLQQRQQDYI